MKKRSKLSDKILDYYKLKEFKYFTLYAVYDKNKFLYYETF